MIRFQGPRNARQVLADLQFVLNPVARPNPVVIAWRWRYELGLAAAVPLSLIALSRLLSLPGMLATVAVLACVMTFWPPARRHVVARAWCVITPHRVRTGCVQAWIHSRRGKIPVVLITMSQPFGERVYLWCRAGTCAGDLIRARELLIAACWARDIQVGSSPRFAQLVTVDVIRYARTGRSGQSGTGPGPGDMPALQPPPGGGGNHRWPPGIPTQHDFGDAASQVSDG